MRIIGSVPFEGSAVIMWGVVRLQQQGSTCSNAGHMVVIVTHVSGCTCTGTARLTSATYHRCLQQNALDDNGVSWTA